MFFLLKFYACLIIYSRHFISKSADVLWKLYNWEDDVWWVIWICVCLSDWNYYSIYSFVVCLIFFLWFWLSQHQNYFLFLCMFLLIQLRPSLTPSPSTAEHGWMCHGLSLIVCKLRPSAMSLALAEFNKSCLFANISTGTPINFSSANNSDNSFFRFNRDRESWKYI